MGLMHNLVMSVIHLLFTAMDVLVVMILVKVIYDRWHFAWLKPFAAIVTPPVNSITRPLGAWLSKMTGKSYPEKTLLLVLIFCLWIMQVVIVALLK